MTDLGASLWLSLRVAGLATVVAALVAVPLAWWLPRGRRKGGRVVEALVLLPLVLPPTVVGYALVVLLGRHGPAGWAGFPLVFRLEGAVLAAATVALPLMYLPARAAFASIDDDLLATARLLGAGRLGTFWHVGLPLARHGLLAGVALSFARALGEFGATLMVFGWQPGRTTLPVAVYAAFERGDLAAAAWPAGVLAGLALVLVLLQHRLGRDRV